ncbi:MAG: hypothetical protein AAF149_24475 [Bacteroidota bacterium]
MNNHLYELTFSDEPSIYIYWKDSNNPESLPALNGETFTILEFTYQAGETPKSFEVNALGDYSFGTHPVVIELFN